jgi:hypothetical protein
MKKLFLLTAVMAAIALSSSAFATTIYTDLPSFLAQVQPGFSLETFTGYGPWQPLGADLDFGTGSYAGHAHANVDQLWAAQAGCITAGESDAHIQLTFGSGVTAVGGNFTTLDDTFEMAPDNIVLTLADATTYTTSSWGFVGFISPGAAIVSLDVWCPDGATYGGLMPTIDNIYSGSAVPEPSSIIGLLCMSAFGLLAWAWRRTHKTV